MTSPKPTNPLKAFFNWLFSLINKLIGSKGNRANEDPAPPGGPNATKITIREVDIDKPFPGQSAIAVEFEDQVSQYVNGTIVLGGGVCTLNNLNIGSNNTILLESPMPSSVSNISKQGTTEVELIDANGDVVSDQFDVPIHVVTNRNIDKPLGGPKATSITVTREVDTGPAGQSLVTYTAHVTYDQDMSIYVGDTLNLGNGAYTATNILVDSTRKILYGVISNSYTEPGSKKFDVKVIAPAPSPGSGPTTQVDTPNVPIT